MDIKKEIDAVFEGLQQQRDELRVQLHLANSEIKDIWDDMEQSWEKLNNKASEIDQAVGETSGNVLEATKLLADELAKGYEKIKRLL